jgi:hypothetical protein
MSIPLHFGFARSGEGHLRSRLFTPTERFHNSGLIIPRLWRLKRSNSAVWYTGFKTGGRESEANSYPMKRRPGIGPGHDRVGPCQRPHPEEPVWERFRASPFTRRSQIRCGQQPVHRRGGGTRAVVAFRDRATTQRTRPGTAERSEAARPVSRTVVARDSLEDAPGQPAQRRPGRNPSHSILPPTPGFRTTCARLWQVQALSRPNGGDAFARRFAG